MKQTILILFLLVLFSSPLISAVNHASVQLSDGSSHIGTIEGYSPDNDSSQNIKILKNTEWAPFTDLKMPATKNTDLWIRLELPFPSRANDRIFIERVEKNFQVIANGIVIYQYGNLDDGEQRFYGMPNHYIAIPEKGTTTLYFRIHSHSHLLGLYGKLIYGDGYKVIKKRMPEILFATTQVGIIFFCTLISMIIYVTYKRDRIFLIFALLMFFLGIFTFLRSRVPYLFFVPEYHLPLYHIHFTTLFIFGFFFILFYLHIIGPGIFKINRFICPVYISAYFLTHGLVLLKIIELPAAVVYTELFFIPVLLIMIVNAISKIRSKVTETETRMLSFGLICCVIFAIIDILKLLFRHPLGFNFTNTGFSFLFFTVVAIIIYRIITIRLNLVNSNRKLETAYDKISESEKNYRILIESTDDLIFTVNENLHITSANKSFKKLICGKIDIEEDTTSILNYAFKGPGMDSSSLILKEKLQKTFNSKKSRTTKANLISRKKDTPLETTLHLEHIRRNKRDEVLCRGILHTEDNLNRFLHDEKLQYNFTNDFTLAQDITERITRSLSNFVDRSIIVSLRYALYEVFINAIEHGNLNISFKEKSLVLENEEYIDLLKERSKNPQYAKRSVRIKVHITPEKAEYWICDEGEGFDFEKIMEMDPDEINSRATPHGRGLLIVRSIFDTVEFLENGRTAHLIKNY